MIYEFDNSVLDTATQELWRAGDPVHVEPQVLAVLEYLVTNRHRVVTKIELLDEVWGDRFVSESALTSRIRSARQACGDSGREQKVVKTVHGRGYRFVADVTESPSASEPRSAAPTRPSAHPIPSRPTDMCGIVGRDDELAQLDAALESVWHGERRSVFVTGEIGVGKSTLLAELLERIDDPDAWFVLRGQCLPSRGAVEPYFSLLDALTHLARTEPQLVGTTLEKVAPSWLAQIPALVDDDMARRLERRLLGSTSQRMLREGADAFEELARLRPVVLALEDLHWADECTLDALDLLLQRPDPLPLLLAGTVRTDPAPVHAVIAAAVGGGRARTIRLGKLDRAAVESLVEERFAGASVPDQVVDLLPARSDGVPMFAPETLATWIRQGQLDVTDGTVAVSGSAPDFEATVPESLLPLIERELTGLAPDELAVLEAAATTGVTFDGATVAAGLGRNLPDVENTLGEMTRRLHHIEATGGTSWPDGTVSTAYTFTHHLYRQVVYERTSAARRAELHGAIGHAVERGYEARLGEVVVVLAEHFVQAGDALRAIDYLVRAGEQAAARSAHGHAADFLLEALESVEQLPPGPDHDQTELRVRLALGPTLVATRGWFGAETSENYERAMELCDREGPCPEAAIARYGLATVTELRGEYERTDRLLVPLVEDESGDLSMEAHELMACSTFHQGDFQRSLENAEFVLHTWDDDEYSTLMARLAEHPTAACNSWASLSAWYLGRSDESLQRAEAAVALGEHNLYALSTALVQRATLHQFRQEPERCSAWADRAREVAGEQGFPMRVTQAQMLKGWALAVTRSPEDGTSVIAEGLDRFRAQGARLTEPYYLGIFADAQIHARRPRKALDLLDEAFGLMQETTRSFFFESELLRLRAQALLLEGVADATRTAREALNESVAVAERLGSPPLLLRAITDRLALALESRDDDPAPWRDSLTGLIEGYEDQSSTPDIERAQELLAD